MSEASCEAEDAFAAAAVFRRIAERLPKGLASDALDLTATPPFGDHRLNDWELLPDDLAAARAAAVLVPLVVRGDAVHLLLTLRTAALRAHAGQIAFPGGVIDPGDATPAAAALREAGEEIGLAADRVTVLGYLGSYLARTGYRIVPVVARVDPPFALVLNPAEVADAFEVPFAALMDGANHRLATREWRGAPRHFYAIDHGGHTIWGITAGIIRTLYEGLYG